MTIARTALRFSAIGMLAIGISGAALADSATLDGTTGPNSHNTVVTVDNTTNTVDNHNSVTIINGNFQEASTGDASAKDNTTVGNVGSGDASNNNTTTTEVTIDNTGSGTTGGSGGNTGGSGGNTGGSGGSTSGSGGSVLGASTGSGSGFGSGATLPAVGASIPVNVSALRTLFNPAAATHQSNALVKQSRGISATFLVLAALLSLLGAFGSAVYAQRRENRV